jgi:hypothetical protein
LWYLLTRGIVKVLVIIVGSGLVLLGGIRIASALMHNEIMKHTRKREENMVIVY